MHERVLTKAQALTKQLKDVFDERLVSVCVYGSSVQPEVNLADVKDNINVVVILDSLAPQDLLQAAPIAQWWEQQAQTLPLFFSPEEWQQSADIFALEYADIRDQHAIIHGKDLYSHQEVHLNALRLICELELHQKLIFLRQRLLIFNKQPNMLLAIITESIPSMGALFRGILRLGLAREKVPHKPKEVFEQLGNMVPGFNPEPFQRALHLKTTHASLSQPEALDLFQQYITQIRLVQTYVDQKGVTV